MFSRYNDNNDHHVQHLGLACDLTDGTHHKVQVRMMEPIVLQVFGHKSKYWTVVTFDQMTTPDKSQAIKVITIHPQRNMNEWILYSTTKGRCRVVLNKQSGDQTSR